MTEAYFSTSNKIDFYVQFIEILEQNLMFKDRKRMFMEFKHMANN